MAPPWVMRRSARNPPDSLATLLPTRDWKVMGKLLFAAAALIGLYALYDGQRPGSPHRISGAGGFFTPSATPGGSVGGAAVGLAGRIGN